MGQETFTRDKSVENARTLVHIRNLRRLRDSVGDEDLRSVLSELYPVLCILLDQIGQQEDLSHFLPVTAPQEEVTYVYRIHAPALTRLLYSPSVLSLCYACAQFPVAW